MNRKLETLVQELALAAINGNAERAHRLISKCPQDVVIKLAYGGARLSAFAIQHLPGDVVAQIQEAVNGKDETAAKAA